MKAPTDKKNDTVQILVTRACDIFTCSNCTQLLPFRGHSKDKGFDPMHMSPDVFRKALRSLDGWPGVRAMFGGNPCVHPKFEDLCQIMVEEVPDKSQRGLWTNNLMGHGELVKEVFWPNGRFNLNVHHNVAASEEMLKHLPGKKVWGLSPVEHSSMLVNYRDHGISDEEWVELRENCDINQNWSSAIMERNGVPHAYFCEVAGSMDAMRGESNGIPVEPGWWKWKMDKFQSQVENCCDKGCGVPLRAKGSLDTDHTYQVSPSLRGCATCKLKSITIADSQVDTKAHEFTDYMGIRK